MAMIEITSERLILKQIDKSYGEKVAKFYTENKLFLSKWEPSREEEFFKKEYHENMLSEILEKYEEGKMISFWLFEKTDSEEPIGVVNLSEIIRGGFLSCFMGYKIAETHTNKGYMTEAVTRVVEYAFNEMGLHRIEANIIPRNHASLKVVGKCGFVNEGLSRKYLKINGVWEDHIHMVILNENML